MWARLWEYVGGRGEWWPRPTPAWTVWLSRVTRRCSASAWVCECLHVRGSVPSAGVRLQPWELICPEPGKTRTQGQLLDVRAQLLEWSTLYICLYFHQQTSDLLSQREEQDDKIELKFSVLFKQDISTELKQTVEFCLEDYLHAILNGFLLFWRAVFPMIPKIYFYLLPLEKLTGTDSRSIHVKNRKCPNAFLKLQVWGVIQKSCRGSFMASVTQ